MGLIMNTEAAATGQPPLPGYVQSFDGLRNVAHLGKALHAMHACSCTAIKKSRDCGLPELEAGLTGIQVELEGLIARLRPAVFYEPAKTADGGGMHPLIRFAVSQGESIVLIESCHGRGAIELEMGEVAFLTEGLRKLGQTGSEPETVCLDPSS